jgi:lipoprotein-anchoring transpeptidase ErfK/SrfK
MADYYSILSRALQAPDSSSAKWRRRVYERAQQALTNQLRAQQPPLPKSEIDTHRAALDAAINRIEAEYSRRGAGELTFQDEPISVHSDENSAESLIALDGDHLAAPVWSNPISWVVVAVVAAAIGAGGYVYWATKARHQAPQTATTAPAPAGGNPAPTASSATANAGLPDGDLPPGVEGGSTDADLPYYFRRQPVFFRTTHPVGTLIIDKPQRFLYLIAPNNVALRYGIGLGGQCAGLAGLRRVTSKAEWPPWQPPQDMIDRKLAKPGTMAGGPGNPLGARVLELDDGSSRINGTNAPKTIGTSVAFGCVRLVNNDIEDLYGRVPVGTRVVVGN